MREQAIQVVEQYIDAVRHNDASALPLHPDAVCEFPTNTYRGAASFRKGLDDFARMRSSYFTNREHAPDGSVRWRMARSIASGSLKVGRLRSKEK
jgi:ketosteroid isomerase-like protein